jgi:hypothetical protein
MTKKITIEEFNKLPAGKVFAMRKINNFPDLTYNYIWYAYKLKNGNSWTINFQIETTKILPTLKRPAVISAHNLKNTSIALKLVPCDKEMLGKYGCNELNKKQNDISI